MKLIGQQHFPPLSQGAKELISYDATKYLARKSGVTVSTAAWSSEPAGLTFGTPTTTTAKSTVLVTIPESANPSYNVKCKFTFSDGAIRYACAKLHIEC